MHCCHIRSKSDYGTANLSLFLFSLRRFIRLLTTGRGSGQSFLFHLLYRRSVLWSQVDLWPAEGSADLTKQSIIREKELCHWSLSTHLYHQHHLKQPREYIKISMSSKELKSVFSSLCFAKTFRQQDVVGKSDEGGSNRCEGRDGDKGGFGEQEGNLKAEREKVRDGDSPLGLPCGWTCLC